MRSLERSIIENGDVATSLAPSIPPLLMLLLLLVLMSCILGCLSAACKSADSRWFRLRRSLRLLKSGRDNQQENADKEDQQRRLLLRTRSF